MKTQLLWLLPLLIMGLAQCRHETKEVPYEAGHPRSVATVTGEEKIYDTATIKDNFDARNGNQALARSGINYVYTSNLKILHSVY